MTEETLVRDIVVRMSITYDFDSETDNKVTVRFRDSMEQERIAIDELEAFFADKFDF